MGFVQVEAVLALGPFEGVAKLRISVFELVGDHGPEGEVCSGPVHVVHHGPLALAKAD